MNFKKQSKHYIYIYVCFDSYVSNSGFISGLRGRSRSFTSVDRVTLKGEILEDYACIQAFILRIRLYVKFKTVHFTLSKLVLQMSSAFKICGLELFNGQRCFRN